MKKKLLKLKKTLLQGIADFIYLNLEHSITQQQFEQWLWFGLWLDSWCVEKDIWLN